MTFLARGRRGGGGHGMGSGEVIMYERVTTGWNGRVGRGKGKGKGREERRVGRRERSCSLQTFIRYFFGRNRILFRLVQRVATAWPGKRGRHVGGGIADGS